MRRLCYICTPSASFHAPLPKFSRKYILPIDPCLWGIRLTDRTTLPSYLIASTTIVPTADQTFAGPYATPAHRRTAALLLLLFRRGDGVVVVDDLGLALRVLHLLTYSAPSEVEFIAGLPYRWWGGISALLRRHWCGLVTVRIGHDQRSPSHVRQGSC